MSAVTPVCAATVVDTPEAPGGDVGGAADGLVDGAVNGEPLARDPGVTGNGVPATAPGGAVQSAIINPTHRVVSTLRKRRHSLSSIDSDQRALIAIQSPAYVHQYDVSGGIQLDGSRSLFTRFERDDTARKVRGSDVSLAKAMRRDSVHDHAPESQASFSATT